MRYDTSQFLLFQPSLAGLTGSKVKFCITDTPYHVYTITKMIKSTVALGEFTDSSGISWQSTQDIVRSTAFFYKADPNQFVANLGTVAESISSFTFPIGSPSIGPNLTLIATPNGPTTYSQAGDQRQLEKTNTNSSQGIQTSFRELGKFDLKNDESISLENIPAGTYRIEFRFSQVNYNRMAASHNLFGVTYLTVK